MAIAFPALACILSIVVLCTMAHADDDFAKIKQQRVTYLWQGIESSGGTALATDNSHEITAWTQSQLPNGSWSDVDYTDQTRGGWKALTHLRRVSDMAAAYAKERAAGKSDPALVEAILRGLRFWTQNDFRNPNWWNNDIGAPMSLNRIMLLMETEMDATTRAGAMKILDRLHLEGTGQNLVWEAGIQLDHDLLTGDADGVRACRDVILHELRTTRDEGIQPDFSFHQHETQQQMGNYGLSFADEMVTWAYVFRGTSLALSEPQFSTLRNYLLEGEAPVIWHGSMDIGSCGRQLFPHAPVARGNKVLALLGNLSSMDPPHAAEYQAAAARAADTPGSGRAQNIDYYTSDYVVHRRDDFAAYLKLCSRRVIGTELINGENLSGRYLADGALWLYESGHEYEDIFPVLDWRRIPGDTCARTGGSLKPAGKMATDFAGGVSDGTNGAAGVDYTRDGVTAKKSWFFLGDRIVCLGAGIQGTSDGAITTSLDQRFLSGPVEVDGHPAENGSNPPQAISAVGWVCAGTRGYVFAEPQTVWLGTAAQVGSWKNVYTSGSAEKVTKNVFSIWLDHGIHPQDASYAYTLLPATTPKKVMSFAAHPDIEILSNTTTVQAVRVRDAGEMAAIFFAPGEIPFQGRILASDRPCALLYHEKSGNVTVADPTELEKGVTISLGGIPRTFDFPTGDQAGCSIGD